MPAGSPGEAGVRALLDIHHGLLRDALRTALDTAGRLGQLSEGTEPAAAAEALVLLAHGVNVRSRAGADVGTLRRTVDAALAPLSSTGSR